MTELMFTKAAKTQAKLRLALFGPSGAGKTMTALRIAKGLGGKVGLIDTERGSASLYADRFDFDTLLLDDRTLEGYVAAMLAAGVAGYDTLIIDSLTHGWRELLSEVDKLARTKYQGNTWSAWSEGTPKQMAFIDALLDFPGHVIATMRSKTEWAVEKDEKSGRNRPVRIGLAPEEGKGIEYEFSLLIELTAEHFGTVIKDRSGRFQDSIIEKPGEDLGAQLLAWMSDGAPPAPPEPKPVAVPAPNGHGKKTDLATPYWAAVKQAGFDRETGKKILAECNGDFAAATEAVTKQIPPDDIPF